VIKVVSQPVCAIYPLQHRAIAAGYTLVLWLIGFGEGLWLDVSSPTFGKDTLPFFLYNSGD
jgi:hypothetical protein